MKFNRVFAIVLTACGQYRVPIYCYMREQAQIERGDTRENRFWEIELALPLLMRTHYEIRYCLCVYSTSSCVNASSALALRRYLVKEK